MTNKEDHLFKKYVEIFNNNNKDRGYKLYIPTKLDISGYILVSVWFNNNIVDSYSIFNNKFTNLVDYLLRYYNRKSNFFEHFIII